MKVDQRDDGRRHPSFIVLAVGVAAAALLAFGALFDPSAASGGLLFGFLFWLGVPVGSMVLLDIHVLTGGRWGETLRPVLAGCARLVPVFAVPFFILLIAAPALYPWAGPTSATKDVNEAYLNATALGLRGAVIFVIWSLIAWAPRPRGNPLLWAGIALTAYGVSVTFAAVDWSMSLTPKWASSDYAALFAIGQITAAFAFAAAARIGAPAASDTADLAAFLIAGILGIAYLDFMQYLVTWAGNLPDKAGYYTARSRHGFASLEFAALIVGGVLPFFVLLRKRARKSSIWTGLAGLLVLLGLAIDWIWQIAPSLSSAAGWAFLLGWTAVGGIWIGLAGRNPLVALGSMTAVDRHA